MYSLNAYYETDPCPGELIFWWGQIDTGKTVGQGQRHGHQGDGGPSGGPLTLEQKLDQGEEAVHTGAWKSRRRNSAN
jgi:hypothetical protein